MSILLLAARVSVWRRKPKTASNTRASTMPTASTHKVVTLWWVSTLSITSWKKIGEASARICMAMAAMKMSRKAAFCFRISGMNQRRPKGWLGSVRRCWRLTKKTSPCQRAQNCSRDSSVMAASAAIGLSTAIWSSPLSSERMPTTISIFPSARRAISGNTPPWAISRAQLKWSTLAFRPMSAAILSSRPLVGSSAPSAYSSISRSGLICRPWCCAMAVRHWIAVWGNLSCISLINGKELGKACNSALSCQPSDSNPAPCFREVFVWQKHRPVYHAIRHLKKNGKARRPCRSCFPYGSGLLGSQEALVVAALQRFEAQRFLAGGRVGRRAQLGVVIADRVGHRRHRRVDAVRHFQLGRAGGRRRRVKARHRRGQAAHRSGQAGGRGPGLEPDVRRRVAGAVGRLVSRRDTDDVAVVERRILLGIQVQLGDAQRLQRFQLVGLADAVRIAVDPDAQVGKGLVLGIDDAVAIGVEFRQGLVAGGRFLDLKSTR